MLLCVPFVCWYSVRNVNAYATRDAMALFLTSGRGHVYTLITHARLSAEVECERVIEQVCRTVLEQNGMDWFNCSKCEHSICDFQDCLWMLLNLVILLETTTMKHHSNFLAHIM